MFVDSLSQTWRDMVSTIFTNESIIIPLKSNIGFKVGHDNNIWFWTNSWLGTATPLQILFLRLYNLSLQQSISLVDVYCLANNSVNLSWKRSLRSRELCMWESLFVEVERGLVFSEGEDIKV